MHNALGHRPSFRIGANGPTVVRYPRGEPVKSSLCIDEARDDARQLRVHEHNTSDFRGRPHVSKADLASAPNNGAEIIDKVRNLLLRPAQLNVPSAMELNDMATRKKSGGRKYSKSASKDVERAMKRRKRGTLRSGGSGKKVKSRKQAIAIGLSEARAKGKKVPRKRSGRKSSGRKSSGRKKSSR